MRENLGLDIDVKTAGECGRYGVGDGDAVDSGMRVLWSGGCGRRGVGRGQLFDF